MKLVISAKRMYEDGTDDDGSRKELVIEPDQDGSYDADDAGAFLIEYATKNIGEKAEGMVGETRCDAIDVTISQAT